MSDTKAEKRISAVVSKWFYTEPLQFAICTSHAIVPNASLTVPFRSGKKRIEFAPEVLDKLTDEKLSFYLNLEVTRILLGHPYQRKPYNAKPAVLSMASDAVIWQLNTRNRKTDENEFANLPGVQYLKQMAGPHVTFPDMNFEQWYKYILDIVIKSKNAQSAGITSIEGFEDSSENAELWEENEEALNDIKSDIEDAIIKEGYGKDGGECACRARHPCCSPALSGYCAFAAVCLLRCPAKGLRHRQAPQPGQIRYCRIKNPAACSLNCGGFLLERNVICPARPGLPASAGGGSGRPRPGA